ncbi:MAG: KH domain-containing protein [Patescibacteria group bacterium]|nr:KH domain-containing protein [Patescibacteria group bacterium]
MDKSPYLLVLENIIKNLVNNPDDVRISRHLDELGVLLKIKVNPQDMGLLVGRRGEMIKAIKTIMRAIGLKYHARLNIKIEEPDQFSKLKTRGDQIIEDLKK